jgi:hypothetical protein
MNFKQVEAICAQTSTLTATLVDDFLLRYCVERDGLDRIFAKKLVRFVPVVRKGPAEWPGMLTAQYIAFRLFCRDGLALKYRTHPEILGRGPAERAYLEQQAQHPWRFCFYQIEKNPAANHFELRDVATGEVLPVYSNGITDIIKQSGPVQMLFLLLGYNGVCWQTYGTLAYFMGLVPSDLLFFARQLQPDTLTLQELPALIERDPVPFMMLWVGGALPLTYHNDTLMITNHAEYHVDTLDVEAFTNEFIVETKGHVHKLALKGWQNFPHFAQIFYHTKTRRMILSALSDQGYVRLTEACNRAGCEVPSAPVTRATQVMQHITEQVLNIKKDFFPYDKMFAKKTTPGEDRAMAKTNAFMKLLVDALNRGEKYDLAGFAAQAEIDLDMARQIEGRLLQTIRGKNRPKS